MRLTKREMAIAGIMLLRPGLTNREIGALIGMRERTVKFHLLKIFRKYGVRSRHELTLVLQTHPSLYQKT